MTGGWYDVFLPWQLKDYAALRAAGRQPHLTIGPWYHADIRHGRAANADALAWFRAHLLGDPSGLRPSPSGCTSPALASGGTSPTGRRPGCGASAGTCSRASPCRRATRRAASRTATATTPRTRLR
ncbi:hypothetical protein GCM10027612_47010 [Microbispora bryophytorum subsp. camponoti]